MSCARPLNAVIGFADLIVQDHERGRQDPQRHSGYARLISDSGRHLLAIVDDLLDLTRVETGRVTLRESEIDVGELIRSARLIVEGRGSDRSIRFVEDFPDRAVFIWADRRLLRQAVLNLIENAAKFVTSEPEVLLAVRLGDDGDVDIVIADNGIGIPADKIEEVKTAFVQVEEGDARRYGGIGLGLSLVREFAELHGGSLILKGRAEGGVEACIRLPAERRLAA